MPSVQALKYYIGIKRKKALYLRLYSVGGIVIPLQPIKPFICPQIEPHEKNRKTTSEERKKNPARRRGKCLFYSYILVYLWNSSRKIVTKCIEFV